MSSNSIFVVGMQLSEQVLVIYQDLISTKNEGNEVRALSNCTSQLTAAFSFHPNRSCCSELSLSTFTYFIFDWIRRCYDSALLSSERLQGQFRMCKRNAI